MSGWAGARLAQWSARSPRMKAVRLLVQTSRPLSALLVLDVVFISVLPVLMLVAMGVMVGRIPATITAGFGSPAGDALVSSLVAVAILFLLSMLATPYHEMLGAAIKARLTYAMQHRLMTAVSSRSASPTWRTRRCSTACRWRRAR
jgi:hypothetical protein